MAVNPDRKFNNPELQKIADTIAEDTKKDPSPNEENEYLIKAQKKFAATEWEQKLALQIHYGRSSKITVNDKEYNARTVGSVEENDMNEKQTIWERMYVSYQITVSKLFIDVTKPEEIDKMKIKIKELKKPVDDADNEYFASCALYYYGIDKETALKNKELLMAYIIGRKYLHNNAIMGSTFNDIAKGKATDAKNNVNRFITGITDGQY